MNARRRTLRVAILTDHPDDRIASYCHNADVLVTLGDLYPQDIPDVAIPHLYVHGNHDNPATPLADAPGRHNLHLRTVAVDGVTFGGFEGSPRYKPRGHYLYDDEEVARLLADLPRPDVLLTHAPATCLETPGDAVHRGFPAFDDYIERVAPAYHLCGHVHDERVARLGGTVCLSYYGATLLKLRI